MRSIVFSTVSHLDMYTGEDRKDRWRPLLELLRIHDFKVDRLYFFISHLYRHIVPTLVKDMNNVCPETEIVPVITNLNGVLTYEDIAPAYKVFSAYFEQYRFDLSNERYFFHLGPGNLFQHALMLIMLFHFKRLPRGFGKTQCRGPDIPQVVHRNPKPRIQQADRRNGACGHPLHRARPAFRPHRLRQIPSCQKNLRTPLQ